MALAGKKYNQLYEFLWDVYTHTYENRERLNLIPPTPTYTAFVDAFVDFGNTHNKYFFEKEQTLEIQKTLTAQSKIAQSAFSTFWKSLKSDLSLTLTPTDYVAFGKAPAKTTRTIAPPPIIAPDNFVIQTKRLTHKVRTFSPKAPQAIRLPNGVKTIKREVAITDTTAKPPENAYTTIDDTHRSQHLIFWDEANADRFGWLITRYANGKGEMGPKSPPLMLKIT